MTDIDEELANEGLCAAIDSETGEVCTREAGAGIDQVVYRGRCSEHTNRGAPPESMQGNQHAVGNDGGPPEGSQNGLKHGLYADRSLLYDNLDAEVRHRIDKFIDEVAADWERETGQTSSTMFRRERLRPIALMMLVEERALDDLLEHGWVRTSERTTSITTDDGETIEATYEIDVPRRVATEMRRLARHRIDALGDLGLLAGVAKDPDPTDDRWANAHYEFLPPDVDADASTDADTDADTVIVADPAPDAEDTKDISYEVVYEGVAEDEDDNDGSLDTDSETGP